MFWKLTKPGRMDEGQYANVFGANRMACGRKVKPPKVSLASWSEVMADGASLLRFRRSLASGSSTGKEVDAVSRTGTAQEEVHRGAEQLYFRCGGKAGILRPDSVGYSHRSQLGSSTIAQQSATKRSACTDSRWPRIQEIERRRQVPNNLARCLKSQPNASNNLDKRSMVRM